MLARRVAIACALTAFGTAGAVAGGACEGGGGSSAGAGGGTGGEGGCLIAPVPLFNITVRARGGLLPEDTTIRVTWSAGEEPAFVLGDKTTWKTLDEANLVCEVDASAPPPEDLEALVCHLWTSGATRVEISAKRLAPYDETLAPTASEACEGFIPRDVAIELDPDGDGGPG